MVSGALVRLNNLAMRFRRPRCRPEELLVLIPSCLQSSKCSRKITVDIANCKRCGGCKVGAIVEMAQEYGVRVACATGGRLAMSMVKDKSVKCVVAVACERELSAGIMGVFPKPVRAIENLRPNGPCRDTDVGIEDVRGAIEGFVKTPGAAEQKAGVERGGGAV